jgi:hypothetical protein
MWKQGKQNNTIRETSQNHVWLLVTCKLHINEAIFMLFVISCSLVFATWITGYLAPCTRWWLCAKHARIVKHQNASTRRQLWDRCMTQASSGKQVIFPRRQPRLSKRVIELSLEDQFLEFCQLVMLWAALKLWSGPRCLRCGGIQDVRCRKPLLSGGQRAVLLSNSVREALW